MLTVTEAQQIVLTYAQPLAPTVAPLDAGLLGRVLAEEVVSDLDMPPYDKAMMDGYAVRVADVAEGKATLQIVEEITAGRTPEKALGPGQAARIMTGAPVPIGADAVVMIERTRLAENEQVEIEDKPPKPGQHILERGREMRMGEAILTAGMRLRPQEMGLLAAVGWTRVKVYPAPVVAILPTGDEIVDPAIRPGPGQIRNSNGAMLIGQVQRAGGVPRFLGIARDNVESLRTLIQEGLQADVLILSGGVSAGKLDLVPGVLQELGVAARFHKVAMKPGKPVYFGTANAQRQGDKETRRQGDRETGSEDADSMTSTKREVPVSRTPGLPVSRSPCLVFGMPGNPVSSLVCFELFVRPALRRLQNLTPALSPLLQAELAEDFRYRTDRPTYHPARLEMSGGRCRIHLVPWFGSPDLRGLAGADAFAIIEPGDHQLQAGQMLEVLVVE